MVIVAALLFMNVFHPTYKIVLFIKNYFTKIHPLLSHSCFSLSFTHIIGPCLPTMDISHIYLDWFSISNTHLPPSTHDTYQQHVPTNFGHLFLLRDGSEGSVVFYRGSGKSDSVHPPLTHPISMCLYSYLCLYG